MLLQSINMNTPMWLAFLEKFLSVAVGFQPLLVFADKNLKDSEAIFINSLQRDLCRRFPGAQIRFTIFSVNFPYLGTTYHKYFPAN